MKDSCPNDSEETAMPQRLSLYVLNWAKFNILSKKIRKKIKINKKGNKQSSFDILSIRTFVKEWILSYWVQQG